MKPNYINNIQHFLRFFFYRILWTSFFVAVYLFFISSRIVEKIKSKQIQNNIKINAPANATEIVIIIIIIITLIYLFIY